MSDEVIPDQKSWVWVLERRCEDCGFDASTFDPTTTGACLRDLGERWQAVLARPDVAVRPRPGVWSPLEYGCHVRDVFVIFDRRLTSMLEQDDPRFENWDQDRTAVEDDYGSQSAATVSAAIDSAASALAGRFDAVATDQWSRTGVRSDGSAFTVRTLAQYLMHDPVHHLWDVRAEVPDYR